MKVSFINYKNFAIMAGLLGGLASCSHINFSQNAKEKVIPYMTGAELVEAEKYAKLQPDHNNGQLSARVVYWDSLILENSIKDAYTAGKQMVNDSASGNPYKTNPYKIKFDTIIPRGAVYNLDKDYANSVTADEFVKTRNSEPSHSNFYNGGNGRYYLLHYWNVLLRQFKQREAFEKGAEDARAEITK